MAELELSHESNDISGVPIFKYSMNIQSGTTGDYIILPDGAGKMATWEVALIVTSGNSGKVQYTISEKTAIAGNTATWFDWDNGTVTSSNNTAFENVTAVRGVSVSGSVTIEVRVS